MFSADPPSDEEAESSTTLTTDEMLRRQGYYQLHILLGSGAFASAYLCEWIGRGSAEERVQKEMTEKDEKARRKAIDMVRNRQALLFIGSPMCTAYFKALTSRGRTKRKLMKL